MRFFIFITLLILSSCRWFTQSDLPFLMGGYVKPPEGTPTFVQGWKDGCGTSSYTRGNIFYKTIHAHHYDAKLIDNPEYRFGYSRGYTTCFTVVVSGNSGPQASFDRYLLPYGNNTVFDMTAGNINEAWYGFFGEKGSGIWAGSATNSDYTFDSSLNVLQRGGGGDKDAGTVFGGNPLWAGGSSGQFFGQ